jgi:uncharacterized protein DUF1924
MRKTGLTAGLLVTGVLGLTALSASAMTPAEFQKSLETAARGNKPGFTGFSAQRGEQFFKEKHGNDWSCSTCHTENPLAQGRHATTAKDIAPLAPLANPRRFTDAAKVDKWFKRNCNDVLNRACSPLEQGDVLQYLMSLR